MPLTPNNREEHWLQGMVDGQTTLEPNKRREYWYKEIVDAIGSGGGGGTGGGVLVANMSFVGGSLILDKTYGEIKNANYALVKNVSDGSQISYGFITGIIDDENGGDVYLASPSLSGDEYTLMSILLHADTENDYPSVSI